MRCLHKVAVVYAHYLPAYTENKTILQLLYVDKQFIFTPVAICYISRKLQFYSHNEKIQRENEQNL